MANLNSLKINNISFIDIIYPIGSIFQTHDSTFDPNTAFGGVWERIKGKFLVGVDEDDTDYNVSEMTGGEKKHTLTKAETPKVTGFLKKHAGAVGSDIHIVGGCFEETAVISNQYFTPPAFTSGARSVGTFDFNNGGGTNLTTTFRLIIPFIFGQERNRILWQN